MLDWTRLRPTLEAQGRPNPLTRFNPKWRAPTGFPDEGGAAFAVDTQSRTEVQCCGSNLVPPTYPTASVDLPHRAEPKLAMSHHPCDLRLFVLPPRVL